MIIIGETLGKNCKLFQIFISECFALSVESWLKKGYNMSWMSNADCEVRRELLRGNKPAGIARLDEFC
jgi:hypothetical protein